MHVSQDDRTVFISSDGGEQKIQSQPGETLLTCLQSAGVYLPALCGGQGTCGKCKIQVVSGFLEPSPVDRVHLSEADLQGGFRLACTAYPTEALSIHLPETGEQAFQGINRFEPGNTVITTMHPEAISLEKSRLSFTRQVDKAAQSRISLNALVQISKLADKMGKDAPVYVYRDKGTIVHISERPQDLYVIGIDIGTTTIAFALVNVHTGQIPGRLSMVNKQRKFGADVISRIQQAQGGALPDLSQSVRKQITQGIATLCRNHGIDTQDVGKIAIAANTTMIHLLLGLSCNTLGQYPFTPVTLDMVSFNYGEVFEGNLTCEVVILPGISTYVGADIVSDILFAEMYQTQEPELLIDIGTNGEMALATAGKILCTATSAGPAFEGGNIRWGTGSVPGAIASVIYQDGRFTITTIENHPPIGICGSGVVDIVYQGLKNGLILPNGRFNQTSAALSRHEKASDDKPLPITDLFLAQTEDAQDITFCQKDVRELQLAKSAIRSGIDALLHHAGLGYDAIKTLFIAGGFGYNLNFDSGAGIGLIPRALKPKVKLIGNSALGGTVRYLLNPDNETTLNTIVDISEEYSLPEDRYFNDIFIDNIDFE
ncbi:MAG: ASKHA domain-containing protein [Treponema sp.]|jgi:uncharacterized 2Fe-2S/4Fe-4S cluster protein (DUF4445 family)|nr:ASKHA domain-containing protein [Treponema sp.]